MKLSRDNDSAKAKKSVTPDETQDKLIQADNDTANAKEANKLDETQDILILDPNTSKNTQGANTEQVKWLARKCWKTEYYRREELKSKERQEYRKALRQKQYQEYQRKFQMEQLRNAIAQRELSEARWRRAALLQKDERSQCRLNEVRKERAIMSCQRHCDEQRKFEAVYEQRDKQLEDEARRKIAICQQLNKRQELAEQLRNDRIEGYKQRLQYKNYMKQLLHEKNWNEAQRNEMLKAKQLKEDIRRKEMKSQCVLKNYRR